MEYDDAAFRAQMPEFSDKTKYPESVLSAFWNVAKYFIEKPTCPLSFLDADTYPIAINYLAAHLWVLSNKQQQEVNGGGDPGDGSSGFVSSATIDKISVTMQTLNTDNAWKYWLNQTPYGQALSALLTLLATGGFSVGGLPERLGFRKVGGVFF